MDSAAARPDDEEARRRRSTDCIYFLASPLTCKKGTECEFRHSDAARMNPRDCWYWFSGNCANPKCSFRHPPLDSLPGAPPSTPRPPQQPTPQPPVPTQPHGSVPAKQPVPCYYFQKGMCAKGDRCAFSHGPQSPQSAAKVFTPALQPNTQLKNSWTKPNSSSGQQNAPAGIPNKSKVSVYNAKPVQQQDVTNRVEHSSRTYQNHINSYAQSGATKHYQPQSTVKDGLTGNDTEVGEFVREPSAGSVVPVGGDDDVDGSKQSFMGNQSSYHHRTNGTGMTRQAHGGYEPERSYRSSAERLSSEKRISHREPMPAVGAGISDLRHRLLKQRRLNNSSRSTEAPDMNDKYLEGECNDQHQWQGEEHDAPLSRSRLRDRIRLPGETSFDRLGSRSPRGRLSPPKHSDLRGKLHERLKARSAEEMLPDNSAKSLVAKASSGEDTGSLNFAGPKSLAELKAKKGVGSSSGEDAKVIGSARLTSGITSPFEGPKPLSAILKRKREVASENTAAQSVSIQEDDAAEGVGEESQILASDTVGENMEVGRDVEEGEEEAFYPEDDVAYDDIIDEEQQEDVEAAVEDYDYEAADVNADGYDEDDLEDDDDDFARKVGVMIS
ncbi:hypothetical protein HU200_002768 [Digitaria exilis]|uniref:C3H1-type domain-containing protein n=1 Tax=Digitaria exilis TaxID=1010633 RepID=A0A835KV92_9POAL|nr:hypothetical protein HU200_002768 [Digitaria exilis]CAB3448419.1 unnamed protein product [Digitaria exilis]